MDMTKDESGVWSYTTPALAPDLYGYSFAADNETRVDIHNPVFKPNLIWQSNMFLVPGTPAELWEVQDVPHGQIHHHFYKSRVIGDQRDFFVYTPPNYSPSKGAKLPVLYLLHGFSDTANGWTEVGKAHVILDNLIAQGKAKPMVMVMTLGYGVPGYASPNGGGSRTPDTAKKNVSLYKEALLQEVIPEVERSYRVSKDRRSRAIAGLSMGGAESLLIGLNTPDMFGSIGAFSSGSLLTDFASAFPNLDTKTTNAKTPLIWISCGTEDGLIGSTRSFIKWLGEKGVRCDAHETAGMHTWMVWRRNLADLTQKLFR